MIYDSVVLLTVSADFVVVSMTKMKNQACHANCQGVVTMTIRPVKLTLSLTATRSSSYNNNEIARRGLSSNALARVLGDQPGDLTRPGWLDLASTGSIWLPLAPLLGRSVRELLDLTAPGFLAGLI